jgi:multidrug efflux pump subunit AcrB
MPSPFRTIIFFLILTVIGFSLLNRLSVQLQVTEQQPSLTVRFTMPNAAPATIENTVITPLEAAFQLVSGIKSTYAIARNGSGSIDITPMEGADIDFLRFELSSKIRQLYPQLPGELNFPEISLFQPDAEIEERPILIYTLSGRDDPSQLYTYARETLSPKLAMREGVQSIEVSGANEREWRISYDPARLQALDLKPKDLLRAIDETFARSSLGAVQNNTSRIALRLQAESQTDTRQQLLAIPVARVGPQLIYLRDLAQVSLAEQVVRSHYRINAENSLRLLFFAERGTNTIRLAADLRREITALENTLPPGYQLRLDDDATTYLSDELRKITQRTGLSLIILLLFVLLIYRSGAYLAIVTLSLLANLGIAFIFYELLGVTLHLYALAGITVSFGIVIDNSIVMMHHLRKQGNRRVFPALLASTLTTICALVIIWFLPRKWQINLVDFARVLAINLSASLMVAWWLIPALMQQIRLVKTESGRGFRPKRRAWRWQQRYRQVLILLLRRRAWVITAIVLLFGLPVFMLPNQWKGQEWYNKTLGNDKYVENIKPYVNRVLGGTLRLFMWYVYEGASYRDAGETILYAAAQMPPGATLEQMDAVFRQLEAYVGQYEVEVSRYVTQVNSGEYGRLEIYFSERHDVSFPHLLKARLQAFGTNLGGIEWNIYGVGRSFSNAGGASPPSYRIKMKGYNKAELERQAERFAELLLEHPRIPEVNTEANIEWYARDRYEYALQLNKAAIAQAGLRPIDLARDLQAFNQYARPDRYLPDGTALRVVNVRQREQNLWTLEHQLRPVDSTQLSFARLTSLEKRKVASSIHKEDQQYLRMVSFEYMGSGQFGSRYLDEVLAQIRREVPLGYTLERQSYQFGNEQRKQYQLLLLIIVLIFAVCAVMFESFRQAFTIVLLIPVSFIGVFLTFYVFDFPFDQGGYTSFILLSGIVVNSLILLLNDYNRFRKKQAGRSALDVYLKAFRQKITPIVLTVISTVLGMIPFVMHGQQEVFWFSLAVGTMGGLLFSLLLILFFVPVVLVGREKGI